MSQADDYTVNLDANTRAYQQEMGIAVSSTNALTNALASAGAQMQSLWKQADRKLTFLTAANVATLTAAGAAAAQLEQQMSQLQARTVMIGRETTAYNSTLNQLRSGFGLTSADAITLITNLNRLNVPFSTQQKTAAEYIKLAAVTGENVNGLAQSQQTFMRSMNASQNTVQRYSSMIATLNQNYGAGAQATLDFASNIAPLSKSMGMTTQQITGISAAFSKAGADGGAAANVYTKILSDVNRAIQYGSPQLRVYSDLLGVSVDTFKQMPKAEVITSIFEQLNKQGPEGIKTLERLGLEGVRSQRAIQAVVGQGGLGAGISKAQQGWDQTGPFNKASQEALDGFLDTMSKAGQNMTIFAQGVGSTLLPAMNKLGEGAEALTTPLGVMGNFFSQMPEWAKWAGGLAVSIGALVPLLPKLLLGAAGTPALLSALTMGSLGQGFRLGRTPGRELSAAQETVRTGGGNWLYRRMFGLGMGVGDLFNRGDRGRLEDLEFTTRDGRRRNVMSGRATVRDWFSRAGMASGVLRPDYQARQAERERSWARRAAGWTGRAGLGLVAEAYRPLTPNYLMNSATSTDRGMYMTGWFSRPGQESRRGIGGALANFGENLRGSAIRGSIRAAGNVADFAMRPFERYGAGFDDYYGNRQMQAPGRFSSSRMGFDMSPEGIRSNLIDARERRESARRSFGEMRYDHVGMRQDLKSSSAAFVNALKDSTASATHFGRAVGGIAADTARRGLQGAGSAVARGGSAVLGALGGPVGLAIEGGLALGAYGIGSVMQARAQRQRVFENPTDVDNAPGAAYREALGEAAQSTKTFAQIMEEAGYGIQKQADNMVDALQITGEQAKTTAGRMDLIKDQTVKTGSADSVTRYAAAMLNTASPQAAEQLKYDIAARFGATQGQQILNEAWGNRGQTQNLFGLIDNANTAGQPWWKRGAFFAQTRLSEQNQQNVATVQGQMNADIATAAQRGGPEEAARVRQAQLAGFGQNELAARRSGTDTAPARENRLNAMLAQYGVTEDDKASREALTKAIDQFDKTSQNITDPKMLEQAWQDALTGNLANTTIGAQLAQNRQMGGLIGNGNYQMAGNTSLGALAGFGSQMRIDQIRAASAAGVMATGAGPVVGANTTRFYVNQALTNEGNTALVGQGIQAQAMGALAGAGGNIDQAITDLQKLGPAAGDVGDKFRELVTAAEALLVAQRDFNRQMSGQTTVNDRLGFAYQDYTDAQRAYAANPDDPQNADRLEKAKQGTRDAMSAANEYIQNVAQQYRALDHQREQGEAQLARTRSRMLRDFALQQQYAEEDFQRSRARAYQNFNIQRARAEADFALQQKRAVADYNRSREREEEDHNTQIKRMAEDTAKTVYGYYSRVSAQRSWSATGLLTNLQDQNKRLGEQQDNLAAVRKMGLSNEAITQLGLNESSNAQQLARLTNEFQQDPKLVAQYNKQIKSRVKESGKLMRDASNDEFTRMEEDRKKNLDRQNDDFVRSTERTRKDFAKSLSRQNADFKRQMSQAQDDYDLNRERQMKAQAQGWADMQADFDYQMGVQEDNISFFAQQIGISFDEAFKTVSERTTSETAKQVKAMKTLMDTNKETVVTSIQDMDKEVRKPFDEWNVSPTIKTTPGKTKGDAGGKSTRSAGGSLTDSDSMTADIANSGGPGAERHWPTRSHSTKGGASYGQSGGWNGSKSLGPGHHSGTDFPNPIGTAIYAAEDGTVVYKGWGGAYGNFTKLDHGNGLQTWYAHQSAFNVKKGDHVEGGEKIGEVGSTGNTTGPHLHFEVRIDGWDKDPLKWLKGASLSGGGGDGGGERPKTPNFADMKSVKAYEALIKRFGYFDKTRDPFHTRYGFKAGELGKAMAKRWEDAMDNKYGANYSDPGGGAVDSGGKSGARGVWNALRSGGLTTKQAAGVMGNIQHESGFVWNIVQGGARSNSTNHSAGYGLVQWTPGTKLGDILRAGKKKNNLENQIWALLHQLAGKGPHSEASAGRLLRKADTVMEATRAFLRGYERPADQSDANVRRRNKSSQAWYDKYKGFATGTPAAPPGWHVVGENGYEFIKMKGGEEVLNHAQSKMAAMSGKIGHTVAAGSTTNNYAYDRSVTVESVQVVSNDPNALLRQLESEARLAALTAPRRKS